MLDGDLALIVRQVRRLIISGWQQRTDTHLQVRAATKLTVMPEDAVWPTLHNYPYGRAA
jgi:hypothetical protein